MKILFTTYGSLGDLHPCIALALALKERGHDTAIATNPNYRERIEREGIRYHLIRPDFEEYGLEEEWMARSMAAPSPTYYMIKNFILPYLDETYDDLKEAVPGYDAVIAHPLVYASPIVCEELGIPWMSFLIQPMALFSVHDPPLLPSLPGGRIIHKLGPAANRMLLRRMKSRSFRELDRINSLRTKAGLTPSGSNPLFEGICSPLLNLGLFSPLFGSPQRDWPQNTHATGFLFYDHAAADNRLDTELERFLDDGPAPLVFTLGSSVASAPGNFYTTGAQAAAALGRRALLITGGQVKLDAATPLSNDIRAFSYAPYSAIFPRAEVIVHQGGAGTSAQALRAGKPQIVVPFAHDQPDNAHRLQSLGASRTIRRDRFNANSAAKGLARVLNNKSYAVAAAKIADAIRREDGALNACVAIEEAMSKQCIPES